MLFLWLKGLCGLAHDVSHTPRGAHRVDLVRGRGAQENQVSARPTLHGLSRLGLHTSDALLSSRPACRVEQRGQHSIATSERKSEQRRESFERQRQQSTNIEYMRAVVEFAQHRRGECHVDIIARIGRGCRGGTNESFALVVKENTQSIGEYELEWRRRCR